MTTDEVHERPLDRSLGYHVFDVLLALYPSQLLQIVEVVVDETQFVCDDRFVDHLRICPVRGDR